MENILYTVLSNNTVLVGNNTLVASNGCKNICQEDLEIQESYENKIVTIIGRYAFKSQKIKSVILPTTIISIGDSAFDTNSIESITIPSSVKYLGNFCFATNVFASFYIPANVIYIGYCPFGRNSNLTKITVDENNANFCTDIYGSLLTKDQTTFIQGLPNNEVISIPATVKTIRKQSIDSFSICKHVVIYGNIYKFEDSSLNYLYKLTDIYYFGKRLIKYNIVNGVDTSKINAHVCNDYAFEYFGNIIAEKSGFCARKEISCKRNMFKRNSLYVYLYICLNFNTL